MSRKLFKATYRAATVPMLGACALAAVTGPTPASADPPKTVVLEAGGHGTAVTIDIYDPKAEPRLYNQALPYSRSVTETINSGDLFQIVAVPKGSEQPSCRILVNGAVVAQEPKGGSGQCIWTAP